MTDPRTRVPDGVTLLEMAFDAGSLYALRAAVAAHASAAGLGGRAEDLVIVAHEMAANAVRHGGGRGRIRLWRDAGSCHCEVTDNGPPLDGGDGHRGQAGGGNRGAWPGATASWPAETGHGLWLIRRVADETQLRSGPAGTSVTARFDVG